MRTSFVRNGSGSTLAKIEAERAKNKAEKDKIRNEKLVKELLSNAKLPDKIAKTSFSKIEMREGIGLAYKDFRERYCDV